MGFLNTLFGGGSSGDGGPNEKKVRSAVANLEVRHGEPARRYQAAERLAEWKTPLAIDGLLRRFTFHAASESSDEDEKTFVAELVQKIGKDAVPSLERYLRTEAELNWPLRILSRIVDPAEFRDRVVAILNGFDIHFDRTPERKVAAIQALEDHGQHPAVLDAVRRMLEDTDDTVRIAALALLAGSSRPEELSALIDALVTAGERPRVAAAAVAVLVDREAACKGRKAEVEPLLPSGYYLTREGTVKKAGQ